MRHLNGWGTGLLNSIDRFLYRGGGAGGEEEGTRRFKPDKGFSGVDYGAAAQEGAGGPVQFERDAPEEDPFGLNSFISDVRPPSSNQCHSNNHASRTNFIFA